jgi:hypothetical protein
MHLNIKKNRHTIGLIGRKTLATKTAKKKASKPAPKKDAEAFMTLFHKNKSLRAKVRKGWNDVIAEAKKKGYTFTRKQLSDHIKKRHGIKSPPGHDEPDTCICI